MLECQHGYAAQVAPAEYRGLSLALGALTGQIAGNWSGGHLSGERWPAGASPPWRQPAAPPPPVIERWRDPDSKGPWEICVPTASRGRGVWHRGCVPVGNAPTGVPRDGLVRQFLAE
jgi:hypothetical protein